MQASPVIEDAIVSIGELSDEAAEAKNKDIKRYRLQHKRKMSRIVINMDVLNMVLLSSNSFISDRQKLPCKKKYTLPKSTIKLLQE